MSELTTDPDAAALFCRSAVQALVDGRLPAWIEDARSNGADAARLEDMLAALDDPARTLQLAELLARAPTVH